MRVVKTLMIVTNIGSYSEASLETGLWLSKLTHLFDAAKKEGCETTLASPAEGKVPIDPESLKTFMLDKVSKKY